MTQHSFSHPLEILFLALQSFNVLFLLFHDFIPLGRLSNLAAIRSQDTILHSIGVSLLGAIPAAYCLYSSARFFAQPYPHWLQMWIVITYSLLVAGLLRAWWIPYLFLPDPVRAARYRILFADTHTFLPRRNGFAPDTLHTVFHTAVVATLLIALLR